MTAQYYSYRPLPPKSESKAVWKEMTYIQQLAGAKFFRFTYFDKAHPSEIYPHGFYLEGWDKQEEIPAFEFPVTLADTNA
jgi:hypothetical protein